MEGKASKIELLKDAGAVIQDLEDIIKTKKKNIFWIADQQGKLFQKFKVKSSKGKFC